MAQEEARYERNPDYIFRRIAEEAVLVPLHQQVADMDCIYTMNSVGAFVWEKLDGRATLSDLQAAMLDEYAAEPEVLIADLEVFLQDMVSIGALRKV